MIKNRPIFNYVVFHKHQKERRGFPIKSKIPEGQRDQGGFYMLTRSSRPIPSGRLNCLLDLRWLSVNIPRIIHQTLPSKSRIAFEVSRNIESLKSTNPGWCHSLYDDSDIEEVIHQHYDQRILKAYRSISPLYGASRADLFRYLLIFKMGGVYLDIKSGCKRPLDSFIKEDDTLLLSHWHNRHGEEFEGWGIHPDDGVDSEFQNWHIICAPNHPIIQAVIESVLWNLRHYSMRQFGVGRGGVLRTTGPIAYTKAIMPLLHQNAYRIFDSDASGLIYSTLPLCGRDGLIDLFGKHYSQMTKPVVSSIQQTTLHYAKRIYHRLLRLIPWISQECSPWNTWLESSDWLLHLNCLTHRLIGQPAAAR